MEPMPYIWTGFESSRIPLVWGCTRNTFDKLANLFFHQFFVRTMVDKICAIQWGIFGWWYSWSSSCHNILWIWSMILALSRLFALVEWSLLGWRTLLRSLEPWCPFNILTCWLSRVMLVTIFQVCTGLWACKHLFLCLRKPWIKEKGYKKHLSLSLSKPRIKEKGYTSGWLYFFTFVVKW